jgi:formate C-acetyltransferase
MDRILPDSKLLLAVGEPFAAGLCELSGYPPAERYARAWRRWLEHAPLPVYDGQSLYPCGKSLPDQNRPAVAPSYSFTFSWNQAALADKAAGAEPVLIAQFDALTALLSAESAKTPDRNHRHTVGGNAYTHAIVRYDRVLHEGLDSYEERAYKGLSLATDPEKRSFYTGMLDLLAGIRIWHGRVIMQLRQSEADGIWHGRLLDALSQVPFRPARTFYEAIVAYNFVYFLDGCDNPGRMDQVLQPFYDIARDETDAWQTLSDFADNVSINNGWSIALGGTAADGKPAYNDLTSLIMRAMRGRFRPSIELRVRRDMQDAVWVAAFDALASGNGQPAFYNEEAYLNGLRAAGLGIREADLALWNGGGCTETMLHGCSNVGSLDAGFNLPLILADSLGRTLKNGIIFDDILESFAADIRREITDALTQLNEHLAARAQHRPQPMRSLLIDDCLDLGRDFNDGGARYNWSVVNVAGLANVADALEALRIAVFVEQLISPDGMRDVLAQNFAGRQQLRQRLLACPKFGNDEPSVDHLAARIATIVYDAISAVPCIRGGRFLPAHIMFETFASAGAVVGALPDGRLAGEALADSVGPVQGRDRNGPTALLRSVSRLPLQQAIGTPVLNLRLVKSAIADEAGQQRIRQLIEVYFSMGGLQIQLSLLDRTELEDALAHPERHEDLIVRIGGYSTYFNRLTLELKREVIKRTEYMV